MVAFAVACGVGTPNSTDGPDFDVTFPPSEGRTLSKLDLVTYGPDVDWITLGGSKWILHPPLHAARQMMGEELYADCTEHLAAGSELVCRLDTGCETLMVFPSGNVQLEINSRCFRHRFERDGTYNGPPDGSFHAGPKPE